MRYRFSYFNMLPPIATQNVLINSNRVSYGVFGQGDPVVLIHGTPSSSLIWRNIVPILVDAGFKVFVWDLLGYGVSERPWNPEVDTSISGQVPILTCLFQHWGLETAHIIAHDIGGAIAQRLSVFHQEKVRSLTMIDVVSFDSYPSKRTKEQMANGLEPLIKRDDQAHRQHFEEWLLSTVKNEQRFSQSSLPTFLEYISGPIGQPSLFQHQVRHYDPKHTMEIADKLHQLGKLPVQIIWGADDSWQVVDWAHKLHEAIPGSHLSILEGCGHFSLEDKPEEVSELLVSFLNSHRQF